MSDDVAASATSALADWMADRFGGAVEPVGPPLANTSGFDSAIYFVQFRGDVLPDEWSAPLILRVKPTVDAMEVAQREADVQAWLADRGYPAPRVLAVLPPGTIGPRPAQVMQRAPGVDLLSALTRAPWALRRSLRQLAELQVRLHGVDPDGFPGPSDLLDRRLALVRRLADDLEDDAVRTGLTWVEAHAEQLRDAPLAVCHGDYHPLNAVSDGHQLMIVDWSDAGRGDRHGDVARTLLLFELASIAASSTVERVALRTLGPLLSRYYLRCYRQRSPIDESRLALWRPVHLLHGWSQVLGAGAGAFSESEVDLGERLDQSLADDLQRRFAAACAIVDRT